MPIKPENKGRYPKDWKRISRHIRFERAKNRCEQCGVAVNGLPSPHTGSKVVLTVAHLNDTPEDCSYNNLRAMCQRCHLKYDMHIHVANRRNDRNERLGAPELPMALDYR